MYIAYCYTPCGRLWTTVQGEDRKEVEEEAFAISDGDYSYYYTIEEVKQ